MHQLRIFIAFASDCDFQRRTIRKIVQSDRSIQTLCRELKIKLDCYDFVDVSADIGRPQGLINAAVGEWNPDWFIFLFWRRLGSDAGLGITGMEEEWNAAIALNQQGGGQPRVSLYFNDASAEAYDEDPYQIEALGRFRENIFGNHQALAVTFKNNTDFRERFHSDLTSRLMEISRGVELDLEQELKSASSGLLSWPRAVKGGEEIERPELQALLENIKNSRTSTTLVLGEPGSGKSALLAALGHACLNDGVAVFAIKADQLGKGIRTHEDIQRWFDLSLNPRDVVRKVSEKRSVVILIDQLDALSQLVDRQSDRLNVLLSLIQAVSGQNGVHIITTCRAFECRHDIRLNSLDAERLELALPSWSQISPILERAGHDPDTITQTTRDLLLSPLCLKVFLEIARPEKIFTTLQSLLEELWMQKVFAGKTPRDHTKLLEHLAQKMSKDEVLWLPLSAADRWPEALRELSRQDILRIGSQGSTVGFRHQTFYDYTLARMFSKGEISLSEHVRSRQDGLFVRPVLLSTLQLLRDTSLSEYHRQLMHLFGRGIRLHIRALLIEFLGRQKEPDDVEVECLLRGLRSDEGTVRVLASIAGSPGWFRRVSSTSTFRNWLKKPPRQAVHALNVLSLATQFAPEPVLDLVEQYWLPQKGHDDLTLRVFSYLSTWTIRAIDLASIVLKRKPYSYARLIIDKAAESSPELAPILLQAALEGRLKQAQAVAAKIQTARRLLPFEKIIAGSTLDGTKGSLVRLIENGDDWYHIETLAEAAPEAFLKHIWPWFLDVIRLIAHEEHPHTVDYRDDPATYNEFGGELRPKVIVEALLTAMTQFAKEVPEKFLTFASAEEASDLKIVHRLLARGFLLLVDNYPEATLGYLLRDTRRLSIGDRADVYRESKALIAALSSRITGDALNSLEKAIINFTQFKKTMPGSPKERFERMEWNRRSRIRLLRTFNHDRLSQEGRAFLDQEERALPGVEEAGVRGEGGWVGARITQDQMTNASDANLLNLFDALPDSTGSHNPRMQWSFDFARAGGAVQQARQLGEIAKTDPERVLGLLDQMTPGQHETYAGEALKGLAESSIPTSKLAVAIQSLNEKGFSTGVFRDGAALALGSRAAIESGLSKQVLDLLEKWLQVHAEPQLNQYENKRDDTDLKNGREILFGNSPISIMPSGRGYIVEAIAKGYLRQNPPNYSRWFEVIMERLNLERHPAVWVKTVTLMPVLFNWDRKRATKLLDLIIREHPSILDHDFALFTIANVMRACEPKTFAKEWIEKVRLQGSEFSLQVYGELLFIYHCRYDDLWSRRTVGAIVGRRIPQRSFLGLAHGAAHLWNNANCRPYCTKVLSQLVSSKDSLLLQALTNLFRLFREEIELTPELRSLIKQLVRNRKALIQSAEKLLELLMPLAAEEPRLVLEVCNAVVKAGRDTINGRTWSSTAENLSNIALTLHRQERFRAAGLHIFERLIKMNVGEARAALEVLDRNPVQKPVYPRPRQRPRRRSDMKIQKTYR